jgi:hypothetical protein
MKFLLVALLILLPNQAHDIDRICGPVLSIGNGLSAQSCMEISTFDRGTPNGKR